MRGERQLGTSIRDMYWVAGLIEGEGSFVGGRKGSYPTVWLAMTDKDVIEKAARILKPKKIWKQKETITRKPVYKVALFGEHAAGWMMTMYPLLGERRRRRVKEILEAWQSPLRWRKRSLDEPCRWGHKGYLKEYGKKKMIICKECMRERATKRRERKKRELVGLYG